MVAFQEDMMPGCEPIGMRGMAKRKRNGVVWQKLLVRAYSYQCVDCGVFGGIRF